MGRSKATGRARPAGDSGTGRSGQGSDSALREMLRRQAQNPRHDAVQAPPREPRREGQASRGKPPH